jgi:hypothetical protein
MYILREFLYENKSMSDIHFLLICIIGYMFISRYIYITLDKGLITCTRVTFIAIS